MLCSQRQDYRQHTKLKPRFTIATLFVLSVALPRSAQLFTQSCVNGIRVEGLVADPSGAAIPGAHLRTGDGHSVVADATGHYAFACLPPGEASLTAEANGFAPGTAQMRGAAGQVVHLDMQLVIAGASANVQVNADTDTLDMDHGAGTTTLSQEDVSRLPDDPDDLLQQLQLLASTGGGAATSANVVVNGFQNSSTMPPKSSIASIRINPDPISPEYERPGAEGGRIEITTKPGSDKYHGALFLTDSDSSFNATDPFSVTTTPAGKRRYGFEFGGPIVSKEERFRAGTRETRHR